MKLKVTKVVSRWCPVAFHGPGTGTGHQFVQVIIGGCPGGLVWFWIPQTFHPFFDLPFEFG